MADYITLMGAEDVRAAGNRMSSAADTMRAAASQMDEALTRHQRFMDDWLTRLDVLISDTLHDLTVTMGNEK